MAKFEPSVGQVVSFGYTFLELTIEFSRAIDESTEDAWNSRMAGSRVDDETVYRGNDRYARNVSVKGVYSTYIRLFFNKWNHL